MKNVKVDESILLQRRFGIKEEVAQKIVVKNIQKDTEQRKVNPVIAYVRRLAEKQENLLKKLAEIHAELDVIQKALDETKIGPRNTN